MLTKSKHTPEILQDAYRFGFNGQEKVNEWAGIGNFMDYKERGQDTRIARFLSVDNLTGSYPWYTPYQFAGNNPIKYIDRDGLEPAEPTEWLWKHKIGSPDFHEGGTSALYKVKATDVKTHKPADFWIYSRQIDLRGAHYYWYSGVSNNNNGWEMFRNTIAEDEARLKGAQDFAKYIGMMPTVVVAGGALVIAGAEVGAGAYVWQGLQWAGRNYGRNFLKEVGEEILENRGNLSAIDWNDVAVGTVTSKAKIGWKVAGAIWNVSTDIKVENGIQFQSGFNGTKRKENMIIDGSFEAIKFGFGAIGEATGGESTTDVIGIGIDQLKTEASEMMEKGELPQSQMKAPTE